MAVTTAGVTTVAATTATVGACAAHCVISDSPANSPVVEVSAPKEMGSASILPMLVKSYSATTIDSHAGQFVVEPTHKVCALVQLEDTATIVGVLVKLGTETSTAVSTTTTSTAVSTTTTSTAVSTTT